MDDITIKDGMAVEMGTDEHSEAMIPETMEEDDENNMYVEFRKPYVFEDETYNGVDLSGLDNISTRDMLDIEKRFYKLGITSVNPENTIAYAKILAQKATGHPIEFFDNMPAKEIVKVKNKIVSFFYG